MPPYRTADAAVRADAESKLAELSVLRRVVIARQLRERIEALEAQIETPGVWSLLARACEEALADSARKLAPPTRRVPIPSPVDFGAPSERLLQTARIGFAPLDPVGVGRWGAGVSTFATQQERDLTIVARMKGSDVRVEMFVAIPDAIPDVDVVSGGAIDTLGNALGWSPTMSLDDGDFDYLFAARGHAEIARWIFSRELRRAFVTLVEREPRLAIGDGDAALSWSASLDDARTFVPTGVVDLLVSIRNRLVVDPKIAQR